MSEKRWPENYPKKLVNGKERPRESSCIYMR